MKYPTQILKLGEMLLKIKQLIGEINKRGLVMIVIIKYGVL